MASTIHHPSTGDIDLATVLKALGDPQRLTIVRVLAEHGEQNCTELQGLLDIPCLDLLLPPQAAPRSGRHPHADERHPALHVAAP